jgi:hypothetical protein
MEPSHSEQSADASALAKKLTSSNRMERSDGERILEGLSGEQRHRLVHQLASDVRATKRTSILLIGLVFALAIGWQALRFWMDIEQSSRILVPPMAAAIVVFFYVALGPLRRQYSALILALALSGDPRLMGLILDALQWPLTQNRSLLREALERSAAQISPEDTHLITPKQVSLLAQLVAQRWDAVGQGSRGIAPQRYEELVLLTIAMVKALAVMATGQERQQLERLARKQPKNEGQSRVREVILVVLPTM